ncbi:MAG: XRE family transcriptional regulator [Snowella sp.]
MSEDSTRLIPLFTERLFDYFILYRYSSGSFLRSRSTKYKVDIFLKHDYSEFGLQWIRFHNDLILTMLLTKNSMAVPFEDVVAKLPIEEQEAIEQLTQELMAEYMTLQDLRKARQLTQEQMAKSLEIRQDSISKLEKRTDLLLSTLRGYVEAMGGKLELRAEFPDRPAVILTGLVDLDE